MTSHPSPAELSGLAGAPPEGAEPVSRHVAECAECRERVALIAESLQRMRREPAPPMPAEVAARLQTAIAAEADRRDRGEETAEQRAAQAARAKAGAGSFGENLPDPARLLGRRPGTADTERDEVSRTGSD